MRNERQARLGSLVGALLSAPIDRQCQGAVCPHERAGDLIAGFRERRVIGTERGTALGEDSGDDFIRLPRPTLFL
jgi:hypothetical protein